MGREVIAFNMNLFDVYGVKSGSCLESPIFMSIDGRYRGFPVIWVVQVLEGEVKVV